MAFVLVGCKPNETDELPILATPTNLRNEGYTLHFDPVDYATSYVINVFGEEEIEIEGTSYVLGLYGNFEFRVKARAEGYQDSPYSTYHSFTVTYDYEIIRLFYSTNSDFDLKLIDLDETINISYIHSNTDTITDFDYFMSDQMLYLKAAFLKTNTLGFHELQILLSNDSIKRVHIYLTDTLHPFRVTDMAILYKDEDVIVQFELFGGTIEGITHMNQQVLGPDDYVVDGSFVIIKKAYIDNFFETHPSYESISLAFDIQKGDKYYLQQIFIDKIIE